MANWIPLWLTAERALQLSLLLILVYLLSRILPSSPPQCIPVPTTNQGSHILLFVALIVTIVGFWVSVLLT